MRTRRGIQVSGSDSHFYHDDPVDFDEVPRKRKSTSILALLALFVGAGFYVQTTLAANVSLNNGAPVEFGQGVSQLTSCTGDSILTLTPTSTFVNASSAGSFYFNSVKVSGIPATSRQYDFTINAYGNTDQAPLSIFNSNSNIATIYNNAGTYERGSGSTGLSLSSGSGTFTATFDSPVALTTSVYKIVIQCGPHQLKLGVDWSEPSTSPTVLAGNWSGVAYGGGRFVAVADGGRFATSTDGDNWTTGTTANPADYTSVAYGAGKFVAVAASGNSAQRLVSSSDGVNWDTRTVTAGGGWNSVTYGNGIFVAVSEVGSTRVITSSDGITWTGRTTSGGNSDPYWVDVTYGNGTFVAVAYGGSGNLVMTSPNGTTWTSRTPAETVPWWAVNYGNGMFVAVGENGKVMTSSDGTTWASQTSGNTEDWLDIGFGSNQFVAVGMLGSVMNSSDGITWTLQSAVSDTAYANVAYGDGKFVAVGWPNVGYPFMQSFNK
jgi:hypothetical protein